MGTAGMAGCRDFLITYRGKPEEKCPKSLRYKAIGNSMAVPVMRWIGCCIADAESRIRHGT